MTGAVLAVGLVVGGCGGKAAARPQAATPAPAVAAPARPAPVALPGYRISAASARGLDGLDLWNAVVFPMQDALTDLDGTTALRRALSRDQYAVYVLAAVDTDIDDGGISEVYTSSSGVFAPEAVRWLRLVGAPRHAAVLARANHLVASDGKVSRSRPTRTARVERLADRAFDPLDADWADLEPLEDIVARYIRAHASRLLA